MDASSKYLVERMLNDVEFLLQQGVIQGEQAFTIRSTLIPLLEQHPIQFADGTPRSVAPPLSALSVTSSPVSLVSGAKSKVPPPPTPASASSSVFSPRISSGAPVVTENDSPYPPSYGGIASAAPASVYAQQLPEDHKRAVDTEEKEEWAKALWKFDASGGDDELRFEVGEKIRVLERLDENWWKGQVSKPGSTIREGLFPASYVELIPTPAPTFGRTSSSSSASAEKAGLSAGEKRWTAPKARFSAPSPAPAPAPAPVTPGATQPYGYSQSQNPTNQQWQGQGQGQGQSQSYGHGQVHQSPSGLQVDEEERAKRKEQVKKFAKSPMGTGVASGVGFGVGASLVRHIL
ncbi:hypothetical protein BCV69DRAFT_314801 [Microstroma glucosiphilum]|uniref:SH3 domain-containing protein n=1 Tax=Pseudomicrostroma glucosiphilum TaxID=1684307 RepID=A0A316U5P0_9BASI|nr:hypothetical protein BCV69DRAFT_314801 [Pseudomicrostroma glucosiphilum]PWN18275.1 hypothetical protein BCV69DRAFT_314801 [Pseudomicrostroma glucosiphilum]